MGTPIPNDTTQGRRTWLGKRQCPGSRRFAPNSTTMEPHSPKVEAAIARVAFLLVALLAASALSSCSAEDKPRDSAQSTLSNMPVEETPVDKMSPSVGPAGWTGAQICALLDRSELVALGLPTEPPIEYGWDADRGTGTEGCDWHGGHQDLSMTIYVEPHDADDMVTEIKASDDRLRAEGVEIDSTVERVSIADNTYWRWAGGAVVTATCEVLIPVPDEPAGTFALTVTDWSKQPNELRVPRACEAAEAAAEMLVSRLG